MMDNVKKHETCIKTTCKSRFFITSLFSHTKYQKLLQYIILKLVNGLAGFFMDFATRGHSTNDRDPENVRD
jgi:hypothetical protein